MASKLYETLGGPGNTNSDIVSQFAALKKEVQEKGLNPETIVKQLLQNGQMTRTEFERLSQMANSLSGVLK